MSVASKRRQGGKVETYSDLLRGLEGAEVEEVQGLPLLKQPFCVAELCC